ncbi:MAG TPA: AMP-binding protein [Bacteroidales bacterium]|nr:AMP-binding protein [Bacteroidales bacterium]
MDFNKIPAIERKSPGEIIKFQEKQLRAGLSYLQTYSKFYKRFFKKNSIDIRKIRSLTDLQHIPVTTKQDLQRYNDDFICVPQSRVIDYMTTSGTLGYPITLAATELDLERIAYDEALNFACTGATRKDIFQLMTTLDRRFMAGLAYFMGLRRLGAGIVRVGSGMPELHWETIQRFKPTYIVTVPSFILKLVDFADANGIDYKKSSVKNAVCIGEPLRNPDFSLNTLGARISKKWPLHLFSTYASTEMGAGFTECAFGIGVHMHPELMIIEFLDENDSPVKEGEAGEITITTLGVEGMPLLRYKSGDVCFHHTEPCSCGRNTVRLGPVIGRKQHMIKYKGTTLYPASLYNILDGFDAIENYVVKVSTNEIDTDKICIYISCRNVENGFENKLKERFRAKLRVVPEIIFQPAEVIACMAFPPLSRKPVKFIDERQ